MARSDQKRQEGGRVALTNDNQVAAIIGSMESKGYGSMDDEGVNGEPLDLFWLSTDAVNMIFDIKEAEGA